MYKLFDEFIGLIGYALAGVLGFIILAVGFTFFPVFTLVVLGLLLIAPLAPVLEKIAKRLETRMYEKSLTIKLARETKQSFKNGLNKAFNK